MSSSIPGDMEIPRFQDSNSVSELIDIFEHEEFIDIVEETRIDNAVQNNCETKGTEDIKEAETEKIYAGKKLETIEELKQSDLIDEINDQDFIDIGENTSLEQEQFTEDIKETRLENEGEGELANQNVEVVKVEETAKKIVGIIKKPKAALKKKATQPSSKTDKKVMAKEKPSCSFQKSKLSKLPSFNTKVDTQNENGAKKISELKRGMSNASRSTVVRNSTGTIEKAQTKDIHSKNTQAKTKEGEETQPNKVKKSNSFKASPLPSFYLRKDPTTKPEPKKDGEEAKLDKIKKSNTFKASPLPSFYHRKDPPPVVPESKKVTTTPPKTSELGHQSNLFAEGIKIDKEDRNNKTASRTISTAAKETIHKLLEGAWEDPSTQKTKVPKNSSSVSSGTRAELGIV
ncbi:hypothetical protein ACHQM5_020964 [Ranunculus cassubicifolius]